MNAPLAELPTQAQSLLSQWVGARILQVHSMVLQDPAHSACLTLTSDRGALLVMPDEKRLSVTVQATEQDPVGEDISKSDLFRYRLRRPIENFFVWKSYDISPTALELEFGLELVLQTVPGFCIEYIHRGTEEHSGDDAFLRLTLGRSQERCRRLHVA